MPEVYFVETRQIRRNHKTVQWRAGETYEYDKDMDPMIAIGHARLVEEPVTPSEEQTVEAVPDAAIAAPAPVGLRRRPLFKSAAKNETEK